jgi:hypothetical protein
MGGGNHGRVLQDFEIKNKCPQIAKLGRHWPQADDLYIGNGYAQNGQCAAYLVVKSITNVQVVNYKNWECKDK